MKRTAFSVLAVTLVAPTIFSVSLSQTRKSDELRRGQYLVERVGMCVDCHSPRDQKGGFIRERWLGGAPVDFKPIHPMPWAETAPPLAGLPGWETNEAIRLLETGVAPDGSPLRPPMPPYKMTNEDARAVVAYLKSLPPVQAVTESTGN
ncbi:MAG: cytochrome c [Acidobacteria bacterium]|nr:MAG: cytochrome c [Acidobacteriota bacterium]